MGKFLAALGVALALAATEAAAQQQPMSGCSARALAEWRPAGAAPMRVEAFSEGPNCAQAAAVIVVRTRNGDAEWTDAFATAHVMPLAEARDVAAMNAALGRWIDPRASSWRTASDLPAWAANAQAPRTSSGFEFYPESWIDRDAYEALRARNGPIYCYVQGMESMACLALDGERLFKVGVQSFPG